MRLVLWASVVSVVLLTVACSGESPSSAGSGRWLCPARFSSLPTGWVAGGNGGASRATTAANSWAHTGGFTNLSDLPRKGVYVETLLSARQPTSPAPSHRRALALPLDLRQPVRQEGSSLPEYRFAGVQHGIFVDLRVDFGRRNPTGSMRERTQRVLQGLRLPSGLAPRPAACR